jgi:hypothetical protein
MGAFSHPLGAPIDNKIVRSCYHLEGDFVFWKSLKKSRSIFFSGPKIFILAADAPNTYISAMKKRKDRNRAQVELF